MHRLTLGLYAYLVNVVERAPRLEKKSYEHRTEGAPPLYTRPSEHRASKDGLQTQEMSHTLIPSLAVTCAARAPWRLDGLVYGGFTFRPQSEGISTADCLAFMDQSALDSVVTEIGMVIFLA